MRFRVPLLIRRSLVRAQVGEPNSSMTEPATVRALCFLCTLGTGFKTKPQYWLLRFLWNIKPGGRSERHRLLPSTDSCTARPGHRPHRHMPQFGRSPHPLEIGHHLTLMQPPLRHGCFLDHLAQPV